MSLKIEEVKFKNYKNLEDIEQHVDGKSIFLFGGNNKGKTSFINGIWNVLTGKDIPEEPVTKGKKKGSIEVDLGEYRAVMKFGKTRKLEVYAQGSKTPIAQPRRVLDELVGTINFDPNHFFTLSPQKQVDYFCKVTGLSFEELDNQYQEVFEARTDDKRKLNERQIKFDPSYDKQLAKAKDLNISELTTQLQEARENNNDIAEISGKANNWRKEITEYEEKIKALKNNIQQAEEWVEGESIIDVEPIEKQIDQYDQIKVCKEMKTMEAEIISFENDIKEANDTLEGIKEQKRVMISDSIDIDGLTYDGEMFLLNGLPFDDKQVNTASKIIAGLKMALFMLNEVRIMKFDCTLLDKDSLVHVTEWSKENDIQLFMEKVDFDGSDLRVVFSDDVE